MICMTTQSMGYDEVMQMPDADREWWYDRCDEYQDQQREESERASSG